MSDKMKLVIEKAPEPKQEEPTPILTQTIKITGGATDEPAET